MKYIQTQKENFFMIVLFHGLEEKTSTSIALKLKFEFCLNPLLVTFSPLLITECGRLNRIELSKMGFDSIFLKPNQLVSQN